MKKQSVRPSNAYQIEVVARALCKVDGKIEDTRHAGGEMWESYIPAAHAVIFALQQAGYVVFDPNK